MNNSLIIKYKNFSKTIKLSTNKTTVNSFRKIVQAIANQNKLDLKKITLEYNEIQINFSSIETKQGFANKEITFEELFKRGGKIFN